MSSSIAVVGSGLVGVVLAISLKQKGFDVVVYDKSKDIRDIDFKGRSINLALSDRGWKILRKLGIEQEIRQIGIPMSQRAIHMSDCSVKFQPYGINGDSIWALSRGELNKKLIDIACKQGVKFCFQTPVWDVDLEKGIIYTAPDEKQAYTGIQHKAIFGADGAYSRVRARMQRQSLFEYQQSYLPLGYKELVIQPNDDSTHRLDPNSFHIWPRKDFMLIALANTDGSFTCTLFMAYKGTISFDSIKEDQQIQSFFHTYFPDVIQLIPEYKKMYKNNPVNSLVTTKCFPWIHKGKVALIGDAAHAVVPFYGQGLNAGLEDVFVLSEILEENNLENWEQVFLQYQESRKINADAIAELSYRNFQEMSEHTADDNFLLRKKIEADFAKNYPELWLPLYDMVTFSDHTYLSALELGNKQKHIMDQIMSLDKLDELYESKKVFEEIKILIQKSN
ncbi:FAD-dependent oxidoreductase [Myroides sp. LJL119]